MEALRPSRGRQAPVVENCSTKIARDIWPIVKPWTSHSVARRGPDMSTKLLAKQAGKKGATAAQSDLPNYDRLHFLSIAERLLLSFSKDVPSLCALTHPRTGWCPGMTVRGENGSNKMKKNLM